jgi:prepilin-type N-terminal cleavage/methylation domain-containing protein
LKNREARSLRAFTIIEVIVVVVILAIMALAIAPRLAAMGGREVRASAMAVGDLVSVAARRDELTSQHVAIEFDAAQAQIRLLTMSSEVGDGSQEPAWVPDRIIPPVPLGDTRVTAASVDGVTLDPKGWRVEFAQGVRRPSLVLMLGDATGKESWRVELPSSAAHAVVSSGGDPGLSDQSVDLDAGGGGTAPW